MTIPAGDGGRLGVWVLLAATVLLACGREAGEPGSSPGTRIPQQERIVRPGPAADSVARDDSSVPPRAPLRALRRTGGPDVLEVGSLDGSDGVVFGEITDVAVVDSGSVVVLDGQSKRLVAIDVGTGAVTDQVGGPGRGPREFALPRGLAYDRANDRLFAVDAIGAMKVYALGGSAGRPRFVESVEMPQGIQDACVLGDTVFLHSEHVGEGGVIAPFHYEEGAARRTGPSFGELYDAELKGARSRMRRGLLECSPDTGRLVFVPSAMGDVRMYSRRGELLWYSVLEDFRPITTYLRPDGGVRQIVPEGEAGFASPHALTLTPDGGVVLQVAWHTRESRRRQRPFAELATYHFSPTGEGEYVGPAEMTYWHVGEKLAVESRTLPHPRILLLRRAER